MAGGQRQELGNLGRFNGRLIEWKGKFGWVQPSAPIPHPAARQRGGKVYLSHVDVEEDISGVGAMISFSLYVDGTGLGASSVRPDHGGAGVSLPIEKPQSSGAPGGGYGGKGNAGSWGGAAAGYAGARPSFGGPQRPAMNQGAAARAAPVPEPVIELKVGVRARITGMKDEPQFNNQECKLQEFDGLLDLWHVELLKSTDFKGVKAENLTGLPDKEDNGWMTMPAAQPAARPAFGAQAGGAGAQRERVTEAPVTGEVVEWRGTFGWIEPSEPIDHKDAKKRGGRIYVAKKDLTGDAQMEKGLAVQFHAYSDGNGLGAEEVMPF